MPAWLAAAVPLVVLALTILVVTWRGRRRAASRKPAREPSSTIVLERNDWSSCAVDDAVEPWARLATEPVRGLCGVPAGRHRIVTTTPAGDAVLDLVVYPGEVLAYALDATRARWEPFDLDSDTRAALETTASSTTDLASAARRPKMPGWLVHLRTALGSRLVAAPRSADESTERLRKRFAKLIAQVERHGGDEEALAMARALGETLVGRPLLRKDLRALALPARELAGRLTQQGDTSRALRVVALGLALLPGDPDLMVVAGCTLALRGESDEALRALDAALERDRTLEPDDVARAMRARMVVRSRLGRPVRV